MFIRDMMQQRAELAMQREAVRILHAIINRLDVVLAPDGKSRCRFEVDDGFLDRLGVWASAEAEFEDTDTDTEGTDDREDDGRQYDPLREAVAMMPLPTGPMLADVGTVAALVEAARQVA